MSPSIISDSKNKKYNRIPCAKTRNIKIIYLIFLEIMENIFQESELFLFIKNYTPEFRRKKPKQNIGYKQC
jgi:hypothetical protein